LKSKKVNTVFINPFDAGVSYKAFLESVPKGITIDEYCKGKLKNEQLEWLKIELNNLKNK